jgi:hypothetical protein
MFTPVPATLPDSTLAPAAILAKFSSQSLAGLGWGPSRWGMGDCPCSELDDSGICLDTTSVGCGTTVSTPVTASPSPVVSTVVATGSCDPGYDYVPAANGCLPQAGLTTTSGGSQVSGSSSSLLSPQLLTALAQGSLTAAQLALAPSPIVVAPIATTTALSGSTMMILLLLGIGGVLLMSESRKGGR